MNSSQASFFVLSAYINAGTYWYVLFMVVLLFYFLVLGSNLLLMSVICTNRSLHDPMYVLLCSLFVNELYGSTGLFPFLLLQILSDLHTVSTSFCFLQIFWIHYYGSVEYFTLAVMSYDRYVAICRPLQYRALMTGRRVALLAAFPWLYSIIPTVVMMSLSTSLQRCGNVINKVYCDNYSIVKLSCSDTTTNNVFGLAYMFVVIFSLITMILYSYLRILQVCFRGSKQTRQKAVGTCTPHLASLLNFSCGCFFEIVQSRFDMTHVPNVFRVFLSLYWLACQPLFNPVMYGLKVSKIHLLLKDLTAPKLK